MGVLCVCLVDRIFFFLRFQQVSAVCVQSKPKTMPKTMPGWERVNDFEFNIEKNLKGVEVANAITTVSNRKLI